MPTATATDLFAEYRADWEAALSPCVSCLLDRCPPGERDTLRLLLDDYLISGPMPPYSPVQNRRLVERVQPIVDRAMNDPAVVAAEDQLAAKWRDTPWPVKRYRRARLRLLMLRLRVRARRQPKPWE